MNSIVMDFQEYVGANEAARMLSVSRQSLWERYKEGKIQAYRFLFFGKEEIKYHLNDIDDLKATKEVEANPKLSKILLTNSNPSEYVKLKGE